MNTLNDLSKLSDIDLSEIAENFLQMHETGIRPISDLVDTWLSNIRKEIPVGPSTLSILEHGVNREIVKRFIKNVKYKVEESQRFQKSLKATEDFLNSEEGERSIKEFVDKKIRF